jgi:hypothetical protein
VTDAGWWDEIVAWITVAVAGIEGLGPVLEVVLHRERPWSTILAVEVPGRRLYAKSIEDGRGFEVPVTAALSAAAPSVGPTVLAHDPARRWLLLEDHGTAIADALAPEEQVDAIRSLLPAYAAMQSATVDLVDGWVADGLPDRRVERLPSQLASLLSSLGHREVAHECEPCVPAFAEACAELSAGAVPTAALDHADIHGTNVVFDGHRARLVDWGDACATHPFASLFVPSHLVLPGLPVSRRAAAERVLRDAYLGPWGGPTAANLRLVEVAMWVAPIVRVLCLAAEGAGGEAELVDLLRGWSVASPVAD